MKATATQIRFTEAGKSYWEETGTYQKEYNELYEKFVPARGSCETTHGELIRAISRLAYEYCNNGNCNAFEVETVEVENDCSCCNGEGKIYAEDEHGETGYECQTCYGMGYISEEEDGDVHITEFYQAFIDIIHLKLREQYPDEDIKGMCESIENIIKEGPYHTSEYFNDERMSKYNLLTDWVIYYVLTTEDSPIPEGYPHTNNDK